MACYNPIVGYQSRTLNPSGKRSIVFNPRDGFSDMRVELPCGQCIGCRLERSRQWAIRCVHEAQLHKENSFITLTFSDEYLDPVGSLRKEDFQKFMKRLRRALDGKVRYFHCGEYGDITMRPHHHAILFGYQFPDLELWRIQNKLPIYRSKMLEELWPFGYSAIGDVTFESCAYVARYCVKKVTGKNAEAYYGERIPPYNTMSRRPGIGADWYARYEGDVYPDDICVIRKDVICKPPKYYDSLHELTKPKEHASVKRRRSVAANRRGKDSLERLATKEECKKLQNERLVRIL